jgi:uncharacterized protein YpuA (DUF1002 family)
MKATVIRGGLGAVLSATLLITLAAGTAAQSPTGQKVVTYGADTTPAERQELAQLFGVDAATQPATVTTQDMLQALQGTGLPVAATDKSISSSALTCLNRGDGLTVRTQNISRITAPVYANAMVTAGVGDATVLVAAPSANPVTGETALVGVLRAYPQCQGGKQPEPARVNLAYEQIARTVALAGPNGDLTKASATMLDAAQPVITGQARDDAAVGASLDRAAQAQGIAVPPTQRGDLVTFLTKLGGLDYGTYAQGYAVQQVSPTEVRVMPAGAGAPGNPQAANPAGGAQPQQQGTGAALNPATAGRFEGTVEQTGSALRVTVDGQERQVAPGPNLVVTRDGKDATLGDIRRDDRVTVTTNPDGSAQRIEARSDDGGGWFKWWYLLPLLLLLLPLLLLLRGKKKDDFILEPDRTGTATTTSRR